MKNYLLLIGIVLTNLTYGQLNWKKGGNDGTPGFQPPILGTDASWNQPLLIHTFGNHIATFSNNNGLYGISNIGEGLRIQNPNQTAPPGLGEIDIFTADANHTEIRFGGSGNIRGTANRFKFKLLFYA